MLGISVAKTNSKYSSGTKRKKLMTITQKEHQELSGSTQNEPTSTGGVGIEDFTINRDGVQINTTKLHKEVISQTHSRLLSQENTQKQAK